MHGYANPNWYLRKTFVFIYKHKINFTLHAFLEILQRYANFLFWVLWACLVAHTQNHSINLQNFYQLFCLSACQKNPSSFTSFLRHYILKNPAIWLADNILAHNSRTRIWWNGGEMSTIIIVSILDYFYENLMTKFFKK